MARLASLLSLPSGLRPRDRAAWAFATVCLAIGLAVYAVVPFDPGLTLGGAGGRVVVTSVAPAGFAATFGAEAGMWVTDPEGHPVAAGSPEDPRQAGPLSLFLTAPAPGSTVQYLDWSWAWSLYDMSRNGLLLAVVTLIGGSLWLRRDRSGGPLTDLAVPIAVSAAVPLAAMPLVASWQPALIGVAWLAALAGLAPLARGVIDEVREPRARAVAGLLALLFGALALAGDAQALVGGAANRAGLGAATALIVGGPVLVALSQLAPPASWRTWLPSFARPTEPDRAPATTTPEPVVAVELAAVAITSTAALTALFAWSQRPLPILFVLWAIVLVAARRFTIRPLVRLAQRATLQRDLVVAAMEAERTRLAADLHDDALQDLTLLVRRLDQAGDEEGARMARHVADRLRAICGDLRLPILDDLGAGPALEWLVERIERLAGGQVRLERSDPVRVPPDVELAVFRVAQEALANAVKHGRPPIVVRYRTSLAAASLSVDDAGTGIDPDAADRAPDAGHFGLLNMRQRAEAIGAILDVRRWPKGGTHVAFEWRGR